MEPHQSKRVINDEQPKSEQPERSPASLVDVDLIRRTKNGDIGAFEELYHKYEKRVYNLIYRLIYDQNDAADLTQEVFVRVYKSIGKLRAEEAFFTWLRTLAVNICRDFIRKRPPRTESLDAAVKLDEGDVYWDIPDTSPGPEKQLLNADRIRAVRKAVASLNDEHRMVIVLHHIEGMDVADVAKMLGSPIGTIKSRLARARDELRRKLGNYVE
jgi:RNA polymerase sigma-70 factor, ECF subfamily